MAWIAVMLLVMILAPLLVSIVALVVYQQKLDLPAIIGMGLIVAGVVFIQLFSKTAGH